MTTYVKHVDEWTDYDYEEYANSFLSIKQSISYHEYKQLKDSYQKTKKIKFDIFSEDIPESFLGNSSLDNEFEQISKKYYYHKMSKNILRASKNGDMLLLEIYDKKTNDILYNFISDEPSQILYFIVSNQRWIDSVDSKSYELIGDYLYI